MANDVTKGNTTRSGRVPSIKNSAIEAMKKLVPNKRKKVIVDSDDESSLNSVSRYLSIISGTDIPPKGQASEKEGSADFHTTKQVFDIKKI